MELVTHLITKEEHTVNKEYAVRGKGFVGDKLIERVDAEYIPRDWIELPICDNLFYLAAYGNVYYQKETLEVYKANIIEPLRLIEESGDCKSIVLVSTSSVLIPHQTFYSASKKAMEEMARLYYSEHKKPVVCVRPSTVTGVGEQYGRLIPTLIRSCLYGEEMNFVPEPTHDFIDVDDFVTGLLHVSQNIEEYKGKAVNISSGNSLTNQEVREIVEEITGKPANVKIVPSMRSYDTKSWIVKPDLDLPRKSIYQSIREMVEYELNNR